MDAPQMFGPYRLDGMLGQGGMGRVHLAFDTEMNRMVALKVLNADLSGDPEYRERFRREAHVASALTDPHVVPIHRHGEIDGQLFLDMRLVEGEDLAAVLRTAGPLPAATAVHVVEQVAAALDSAHEAGLVHRDVKPANVFLTRERPGTPRFAYLGDFGIARATAGDSLTRTGTTVGSLDYMAPERFRSGAVDGRADVYALGCLLHETLTARRPFPVDEPAALMGAHVNAAPPRPSEHSASPPGLDAVVARAMAKDPADRYRSAGELAADARAAVAGERPAVTAVTDRIAVPAQRSGPERSGPERSGPERFGPERFGPERFGPERFGPERFGPERSGAGQFGAGQPGPGLSRPGPSGPARSGPSRSWPRPDGPQPADPSNAEGPDAGRARARRRRGLLGGLGLGALALLIVLNTVDFETGLLVWQGVGTLLGTLTVGNLRPRSWGSGRTTVLVVLTLPVALGVTLLVNLGLGLAGSPPAVLGVTMAVYAVWALTLILRRRRS